SSGSPSPSPADAVRLRPSLRRRLALHGRRARPRAAARATRERERLALHALAPAGAPGLEPARADVGECAPRGVADQVADAGGEARARMERGAERCAPPGPSATRAARGQRVLCASTSPCV